MSSEQPTAERGQIARKPAHCLYLTRTGFRRRVNGRGPVSRYGASRLGVRSLHHNQKIPRRAPMLVFRPFVLTAFFTAPILFWGALPGTCAAQDVRHMCSEKYQAAKAAGTLGEETWPKFYSRCAAELKANPPAAAAPPAAEATPAPLDIRHLCSEKYQAAKSAGTLGGE